MNLEADRVVDFSAYSGMSMRLKKVCPQCDATLHARKHVGMCSQQKHSKQSVRDL